MTHDHDHDPERTHHYEGMFVFPQSATAELEETVAHINELMTRAQATVIAMRKWDERRLAYEIKKHKRGVFVLVYFRTSADKLVGLERDCNLSERLLRSLVTRADHLTEEEMKATDAREAIADEARLRAQEQAVPAAPAASEPAAAPAAVETAADPAVEPEASEPAAPPQAEAPQA